MIGDVAPNAPPTDYAIADLVAGVQGSGGRVLWLTAFRSLLIAPGLYAMGLRGQKLAMASFAASSSITAGMTAVYAARQRRA